MELRVTGYIPASLIEQLRRDLSPLFPIVLDRRIIFQQGHIPAQVRLVGDRTEWMDSLKGPARLLLVKLSAEGSLGSSSDRDRIAKALSDADVEPLKKIARTLCGAIARQNQESLHIGVGLAIPEWQHSTTLRFLTTDEESVAVALARFINQLSDVEAAIKEELRGPHKPYRQVQLEVTANGPILLRWLDDKNLSYHQREVTPPNQAAPTK